MPDGVAPHAGPTASPGSPTPARPRLPRPPAMGRRAFLIGSTVAAAALVAGCGTAGGDQGGVDNRGFGGTVLPEPLTKPTITFTDTDGNPYDFATATTGELALLFFGYTSCPDVCPVQLGIISAAFEKARPPGGVPTFAFVGVDTARDTLPVIRSYLDRFDPRFVGLTATPEQIDAALAELKLPPVVIDPEGKGGNYSVGHPSQIMVYGPDDLCHVVYPFGTRQEVWVDDLPRLATYDWSTST